MFFFVIIILNLIFDTVDWQRDTHLILSGYRRNSVWNMLINKNCGVFIELDTYDTLRTLESLVSLAKIMH